MCFFFGARICHCHMVRETACAQPQVPQHFDSTLANGSSSRCQLLIIAPQRMMLTRELKNPSRNCCRIAQEIKVFSMLSWLELGPSIGPKA